MKVGVSVFKDGLLSILVSFEIIPFALERCTLQSSNMVSRHIATKCCWCKNIRICCCRSSQGFNYLDLCRVFSIGWPDDTRKTLLDRKVRFTKGQDLYVQFWPLKLVSVGVCSRNSSLWGLLLRIELNSFPNIRASGRTSNILPTPFRARISAVLVLGFWFNVLSVFAYHEWDLGTFSSFFNGSFKYGNLFYIGMMNMQRIPG